MKNRPNPMHEAREALKTTPKCLAHARTTGLPCKNASMANGRCRMHGGKSTGRSQTHGQRTVEAKLERNQVKRLISMIREL